MGKVLSNKIYSPQAFVELLTDKCYCFEQENTVEEVCKRLAENNIKEPLVFGLLDAERMIDSDAHFVVVDVSYLSDIPDKDGHYEMINDFVFFQVPDNLVSRFS